MIRNSRAVEVPKVCVRPVGPFAGIAVAAAMAATLAGCGTAPLSYLNDNQVYYRAVLNRYPLAVVAVDGSSPAYRPVPVTPGEHLLTLDAAPVAGFSNPVHKVYPLNVAPCTRYYLAAQRRSPVLQDWDLVVERTFPTGGCDPARELEKARTGAISGLSAPASSVLESVPSPASAAPASTSAIAQAVPR